MSDEAFLVLVLGVFPVTLFLLVGWLWTREDR